MCPNWTTALNLAMTKTSKEDVLYHVPPSMSTHLSRYTLLVPADSAVSLSDARNVENTCSWIGRVRVLSHSRLPAYPSVCVFVWEEVRVCGPPWMQRTLSHYLYRAQYTVSLAQEELGREGAGHASYGEREEGPIRQVACLRRLGCCFWRRLWRVKGLQAA